MDYWRKYSCIHRETNKKKKQRTNIPKVFCSNLFYLVVTSIQIGCLFRKSRHWCHVGVDFLTVHRSSQTHTQQTCWKVWNMMKQGLVTYLHIHPGEIGSHAHSNLKDMISKVTLLDRNTIITMHNAVLSYRRWCDYFTRSVRFRFDVSRVIRRVRR